MTTSGIELDRVGPVATVTLRRPDVLNAQTPEMWLTLRDIGRELPGDVRVVVVRGEGRSFSSGLDVSGGGPSFLAELAALPPEVAVERIRPAQEGFTWLHRPDLVTVAAVQGHALGAGFQLALACDLRVLADDARLAMAEITVGLVPDLGGSKRLVELLGYARALELCLTGRQVSADEALGLGLATLVVPRDDLDSAVADLVAAVLAAPRDAAVEMKALLFGASTRSWPEQLSAERSAQVRRLRDLAGLGE